MKMKAGQVWRMKGATSRVVVVDVTFGGSAVIVPYRLRKSIRRFDTTRQRVSTLDALREGYQRVA